MVVTQLCCAERVWPRTWYSVRHGFPSRGNCTLPRPNSLHGAATLLVFTLMTGGTIYPPACKDQSMCVRKTGAHQGISCGFRKQHLPGRMQPMLVRSTHLPPTMAR